MKTVKEIIAVGAITGVFLAGWAFAFTPKGETYSLVLTLIDGSEYATDTGISRDDCYKKVSQLFGDITPTGVYCDPEQ